MRIVQVRGQFYKLLHEEAGNAMVSKRGSLTRHVLFMFDGKAVRVLRGNLLVSTKDIARMVGV